MENATYFVRSRGKISGPFDLASLQKLVRRGVLSRMHEVSPDRAKWESAGDFEDLFPVKGADAEPRTTSQSVATPSDSANLFFYAHNGSTVGPVPLAALQSLARNGSLFATDQVWAEEGKIANPAAQLPALAAIFSAGGLVGGNPRVIGFSEGDRLNGQTILNSTSSLCQVASIVIGFVLLLFLNMPIGSMFDKSAGQNKIVWWWDALKEPRNGTLDVLLFFVLFSALAVSVVGATVRGLVRGWIFVGVAGLSIILFLIAGLQGTTVDGGFFFVLLIPYVAAALVGVSYFRAKTPQAKIGTIFQAIFGGCLLLITMIVGILFLAHNSGIELQSILGAEQLPGWWVLALTTCLIGIAAALTAGILGLVGMKRHFSPKVNWTGAVCAAASVVLPIIATLIAVGGVFNGNEKMGQIMFLWFRSLMVFCSFVVLLSTGLAEVFVASRFSQLLSEVV